MVTMKERVALMFGAARRYATVCLSAALVLGYSTNAVDAASGVYGGIFVGAADTRNRIVDVDGFSNTGNPGYSVDYDDPGIAGGVLIGMKFEAVPVRIEIDTVFADLPAFTKALDPNVGDETAASKLQWLATARAGLEHAIGPATIFATAGLAAAWIKNSVTDLDGPGIDPSAWHVDPDDSFHDRPTKIGWVIGVGTETALTNAWTLRIEGSYLDFGQSKHTLNRSANSSCRRGGERRACPYRVENSLGLLRLAIIHRFAL